MQPGPPLLPRRSGQLVSQPPPLPPPSYPAATVPGCSPRAIPAHLRPLEHAALATLIKLSYRASGQAYTNRPSYALTEHSVYCLLGPNRTSCHRQPPRAHSPISWKADYCPGRIIQLQPHTFSLCSAAVALDARSGAWLCPAIHLSFDLSFFFTL